MFCGWPSLGFCLFVGFELAHGRPVQFQPIGVVDDAIEDGVGESRVADDIVPLVEGELAGNERRAAAIAVLDDLHQIAPLVGGEPVRAPVVEDQQIGLDQGAEQAGEATVTVGKFEIGEQPRHAGVQHRVAIPARLLGERAG